MNWPRWHWLEDGVLPLLVAALRVCWLWPWLELVRRWMTPGYPARPLPLWAIPLLLLGGFFVSRVALAKTDNLRAARAYVAGGGLAVILGLLWWQYGRATYAIVDGRWVRGLAYALTDWNVGFPPPFLTLAVAAAIWLRGVVDGNRRWRRDAVWNTFATGFAAFALMLLLAPLDAGGLPPNTDRWLIALVAVGLAALALASVDLAHVGGAWQAGRRTNMHLNRDWLLIVALVVVGVLVMGLALAALVTPATVAYVLGWVGWLLRWLGTLLGYVLLAVVYVMFLVLTPLFNWLQSLMAGAEPQEGMEMGGLQRSLEELARQPAQELPPMAEETLRWLTLAGIGVVLLVIFALALRYFRNSAEDELDETRETVFSSTLLQDQLAALWNSLLERLRRASGPLGSPYLSLVGEAESRAAIRALYQSVLAAAKEAGYPRAPGQTPREYKARLMEMCRSVGSAWTTITEVYVAARYGLPPPPPDQVERMQEAWTPAQAALAAQAADEQSK